MYPAETANAHACALVVRACAKFMAFHHDHPRTIIILVSQRNTQREGGPGAGIYMYVAIIIIMRLKIDRAKGPGIYR